MCIREIAFKNDKKGYSIVLICIIGQYLSTGLASAIFLLLLSAVMLYITVWNRETVLNSRKTIYTPLKFVSRISYPLYLLHQVIGFVIIQEIVKLGYRSEMILIVPTIIVLAIAFLIHKFVEEPSVRLSQKIEITSKS